MFAAPSRITAAPFAHNYKGGADHSSEAFYLRFRAPVLVSQHHGCAIRPQLQGGGVPCTPFHATLTPCVDRSVFGSLAVAEPPTRSPAHTFNSHEAQFLQTHEGLARFR